MTDLIRAPYEKREAHLERFVKLNKKAGVDPDVIDLLEAYARLKLRSGGPFEFYPASDREANARLASAKPEMFQLARRNPDLDPRSRAFLTDYAREMSVRRLPTITSRRHLARHLDISTDTLHRLQRGGGRYSYFTIPKATGGTREMAEPIPELKRAQRWIHRSILTKVRLHDRVHGFRRHRSIVSNARLHLRRNIVIRMDLKDFFPSINTGRAFGIFHHIGIPRGVAQTLAEICSCRGALPIGAPTSPALSNVVARRLDHRLHNLGRKTGFSYSRYADDLTFSSNKHNLHTSIPFFRQIINDEGFTVNDDKISVMRSGDRQLVTGIVVNDKLSVPREVKRRLRAVLQNCRTGNLDLQRRRWAQSIGVSDVTSYPMWRFKEGLRGKLAFVSMVQPDLGAQMVAEFETINFGVGG